MQKTNLESFETIDNEYIRQLASLITSGNFEEGIGSKYITEILNSTEEQLGIKMQHLNQSIKEKNKKLQEMTDELQFLNIDIQQYSTPKVLKKMTLKELTQHCRALRSIMNDYLGSNGL